MVWEELGTISPRAEWQEFDISSLDDSLLRITQTYDVRPIGYALISSIFSDGSRGFFRRIYPYEGQQRLLEYEVPPVVREPGFDFRAISIKSSVRARFYDLSWRISIEIWTDEVAVDGGGEEPTGDEQVIDGGEDP